jgi:hypothetical protein
VHVLADGLKASSSAIAMPVRRAPASRQACTEGAVRAAGSWLASQSGLPPPVTMPATSNMSLTAKVRPLRAPCRLGAMSTRRRSAPSSSAAFMLISRPRASPGEPGE